MSASPGAKSHPAASSKPGQGALMIAGMGIGLGGLATRGRADAGATKASTAARAITRAGRTCRLYARSSREASMADDMTEAEAAVQAQDGIENHPTGVILVRAVRLVQLLVGRVKALEDRVKALEGR